MKQMLSIFLLLAIYILPAHAQQDSLLERRKLLQNWGFSHCLYHFGEGKWLKEDVGAASGVYFQAGGHQAPAYQAIKKFINNAMINSKETDSQNNKLIFYKCLKIYNSNEYKRMIKKMDKYS
ncbi:type VI secretion system amidase immunity protein Tai4 [Neisseria sp. Dent CA1/247]|uniref:type VI secretion system amidase immunity protein Tai4 n=1 Tax=Neisseria sp. Dent CA1/247 TaxID=2912675 RepID=UPI001FD3CB83|nr:type VI secretion system amidase immunity protein Tai4 [Neisseria sp. Dent CA1/247]UOO77110.1 type VI secretion system amidase immunity protein Tai4 [Neisseria sp. Dent CA1/247]